MRHSVEDQPFDDFVWQLGVRWMDEEAAYAHLKYPLNNPQRLIESEGLGPTSTGYAEIAQYFGRFKTFFTQCEGDPRGLLNASQQLGKFVGTGRALSSFLLERYANVERLEADALISTALQTMQQPAEYPMGVIDTQNEATLETYWHERVLPKVEAIAVDFAGGNTSGSIENAFDLLSEQCILFGAFTTYYGVIAQPGLPSGTIKPWEM